MKFTCSKQSLYEALVNVSKAAADKSTIVALQGVKLSLGNGVLSLTGYDLEIGIRTSIPVISDDSGDFVMPTRFFSEIVRKMSTEEITVVIEDNLNVTVTGGATEYGVSAISATEYPAIPELDSGESLSLPQGVLKSLINETVFAVSQNDTKPVLKGELFEIVDSVLNVVAIDGFRLAVRTESIKSAGDMKFIVPAKTLTEVSRLLKDEEDAVCEIRVTKKQVVFEFSGYFVFSRLIEGEFHNYRGSIPQNCVTEVVIGKRELIDCLERASLLINERIKMPVRCLFENDSLKVNCKTSLGKISDEIPADVSGPKIEMGFNCKFLLDPLKVIRDEKIKLVMNGGLLPMKIVPLKDNSYTYLVLPVRLKND